MAAIASQARLDLESGALIVSCPACGMQGCDKTREFGILADYECACGWRFRVNREGVVVREFGNVPA